ncbi:MAG: hypothetical protein GY869_18130 [Planctomycetes bacterium]|nr:hypothetical protein [Planctomycetota bacterium]
MKNQSITSKTGSNQFFAIILLITLLCDFTPLFATESIPDPPQLNTPGNPVTIVLDNNRQFLTVDLNDPMNKIYHDGNRDVYGLLGILAIITFAYWLVEHETKKNTTFYYPISDQNKSCPYCQHNSNVPE